jgi:plastocyanin
MNKKSLSLLLTATVSLGVAVPAALAATKSVKVGDDFFVRSSGVPTVTVKKGTTVKWNFAGDSPHNVTVSKGPVKFKSKTMSSGTYSKKVTKAGTYKIYCTIHGAANQSMVLKVK